MKRKLKIPFKNIFCIYLALLLGLSVIAIVYVRLLLGNYEESQPEKRIKEQIDLLETYADNGSIWYEYDFPDVTTSEYESLDLKQLYREAYASKNVTYALKPGTLSEDSLIYNVLHNDVPITEITLRSVGEPITKLAVFTIQEWEVAETKFVANLKDYKITAPQDFTVSVNDIVLTKEIANPQSDGTVLYTVKGIFHEPKIEITDHNGQKASYKKSGTRIKTEFYDYSLTIPASLTVMLNGEKHNGTPTDDGMIHHEIRSTQNPDVKISDAFGTTVSFSGGNHLPLTYYTITAPDTYKITVDGAALPDSIVTLTENPDYEAFKAYTTVLPKIASYEIAVLKDNADVTIVDKNGKTVEWDKTLHTLDLTKVKSGAPLPDEISSVLDVWGVARKWSLFMSSDLDGANYGFWEMAKHLINGSYLYDVAFKWATNIDITFISIHYLQNPPFTNIVMENFEWLTDTCFSIEIAFDKNMVVLNEPLVDSMHSTFTFVKYEGQWKLVQIKEIVE